MNRTTPTKQIVSVTEMARMCGLSRARFYQLMKEGVFPVPSRNPETQRPYFTREQQEQCLQIRQTNQGANGKAVMFYGCRPLSPHQPPKRKRLPISKSPKRQTRQDPVLMELRHGLAQLGLTSLTDADLHRALAQAYPDGHRGVEASELLRAVFEVVQAGSQDSDRNTEEHQA